MANDRDCLRQKGRFSGIMFGLVKSSDCVVKADAYRHGEGRYYMHGAVKIRREEG